MLFLAIWYESGYFRKITAPKTREIICCIFGFLMYCSSALCYKIWRACPSVPDTRGYGRRTSPAAGAGRKTLAGVGEYHRCPSRLIGIQCVQWWERLTTDRLMRHVLAVSQYKGENACVLWEISAKRFVETLHYSQRLACLVVPLLFRQPVTARLAERPYIATKKITRHVESTSSRSVGTMLLSSSPRLSLYSATVLGIHRTLLSHHYARLLSPSCVQYPSNQRENLNHVSSNCCNIFARILRILEG